ncbi:hypothetical protein CA13_73630 [Planctomycetes bacterium CA13]|uniref:Uncharacterized protein n=2 Tax=Novipirellula herctigrandis TaxID=2527986 RepID=A0A5C5YLS8_9BACT|nr:hypothetical protein CA13_73630 [Planctomycetes bacterium CA13]
MRTFLVTVLVAAFAFASMWMMLIGKDQIEHSPTGTTWEMHTVHGWPFPFMRWQTYGHLRPSDFSARLPVGQGILQYQSKVAFTCDLVFAATTVVGFATFTVRHRSRLPRRFSLRALFVLTTMIAILGVWAVAFLQTRFTPVNDWYEDDILSYLFRSSNSPLDYWVGTVYVIGLPFGMLGVFDLVAGLQHSLLKLKALNQRRNHPMQPSGEVGRIEVDDLSSPPADR